jgi:hypothetical protein
MRRLWITAVAIAMLAVGPLPASADGPPLPDFPTGDLWSRANNVHIRYDVSGDPTIKQWWGASWIIPYGYGVAFDSDGYLYLPVAHGEARGIFVYDRDPETWARGDSWYFEPVGKAPLESEGIGDVVITGDRLIASSNTRAAVYVFDIADPFNPVFLHDIDLSELWEYGSVGDIAVDGDGDIWLAPYQALLRISVDPRGTVVNHDLYRWLPDNTGAIAVEEGTGRLFYSAVNFDYISIRDRLDPWTELARITHVCGHLTQNDVSHNHNPGQLAFDSGGDLFVGCSGYTPDGTDVVRFPRGELQGIAGSVEASSLEQDRFSGPSNGGGFLAFRPAEDAGSLLLGLVDDVEALNLDNGISNSLDAKLGNALAALDDLNENSDVSAINRLGAFVSAVEAQAGKGITASDAAILIAQAQGIIDLLSV